MGDKDFQMFLTGKLHLSPTIQSWRRVVILMMMCQRQVVANVAVADAVRPKRKEEEDSAPDGVARYRVPTSECSHPYWLQRKGGNQFAKYAHCMQCGGRTFYQPIDSNRTTKSEKAPPSEAHDRKTVKAKDKEMKGKGKAKASSSTEPRVETTEGETAEAVRAINAMSLAMSQNMSEMLKAQEQQTATILQGMQQQTAFLAQTVSWTAEQTTASNQQAVGQAAAAVAAHNQQAVGQAAAAVAAAASASAPAHQQTAPDPS